MNVRYRSFFWPALFILAGIITLVVNTGVVPGQRLYLLWDMWPVVLIVIGLEIIGRRALHGPQADIASALIVVLAIAGVLGYVASAPSPLESTAHFSGQLITTVPASLELDVASATVEIDGDSNMGKNLYTADVQYLGRRPTLVQSGNAVTIGEQNHGGNPFLPSGNFSVQVKLNETVRWTIRENTGDSTDKLNLGGVHVTGFSQNTGDSTDDITLGPPSGHVTLHVNSGDLTLHVHRPSSPVSVSVDGGSIRLTVDGGAVQRGEGRISYQSPGFDAASDAYVIQVNSGDSTITVDTNAESG